MALPQTDSFARRLDAAFELPPAPSRRVPYLRGRRVMLRDLVTTDASSLSELLTTASVTRFILPPPKDLNGFRNFITWTHGEQQAGRQRCFAMVPHGHDEAAGLIQVRRSVTNATSAEWGFVLGQRFWGTGLFMEGATMVLDMLFATAGIRRLEARTAVSNPRGNGVLRKLGFEREGISIGGFVKDGEPLDEALWSMTAERWKQVHAGRPIGRRWPSGVRTLSARA